jgi:hypothetical protein
VIDPECHGARHESYWQKVPSSVDVTTPCMEDLGEFRCKCLPSSQVRKHVVVGHNLSAKKLVSSTYCTNLQHILLPKAACPSHSIRVLSFALEISEDAAHFHRTEESMSESV